MADTDITDGGLVVSENTETTGTTVTTEAPVVTETTDDKGASVTTDVKADGGDPPVIPETYADFVLPNGMTIRKDVMDIYGPTFKELGLSQVAAQKLVDAQVKTVQASQALQVEAFNQQMKDWQTQAKADKEIGGDNFEKSVGTARIALARFGTDSLIKLMDDSGLSNHPDMIRVFSRIGALLKEDNPSGTGDKSTGKKPTAVEILYPTK